MTVTPAPLADSPSLAQCQAELAQLRDSHEALLRAIAHDLRAPLRHVMSFAPLLREAVQELALTAPASSCDAVEEAQEFAATMEQSARRMARMLDGLTALSRAVRAPLQLQPQDWQALCQEALAQVPVPTGAARLQVHWEAPASANGSVQLMADADSLRWLVHALMDNVVKFSAPVNAPLLRLSACLDEGGTHWLLTVQDNGVGFDGTRAQLLFGLFQRMHRESEFDGVGCGLALVQAVAQRHGATVRIDAQPQQGCTVQLRWPAAL